MRPITPKAAAALALVAGALAAGPALADAPFYFVDHISNRQALFTDSGCTGAYAPGCGKFTVACGTQFWSGQTAFDEGVAMLKSGEPIHIRRNSGSAEVVCTISP